MGIGRSAIGILNREPQPALSADGPHVLVMSGEFYRTGQLRQRLTAAGAVVPAEAPDHELALAAFRALGHDCTSTSTGRSRLRSMTASPANSR